MNEKVKQLIDNEFKRQNETLGLIPSENFSSKAVREAVGSVFMHKYSEGFPGARYYEGNEIVDQLENECRRMILKVMIENTLGEEIASSWHANVQVLSGSVANLAVFNAVLNPGDKILSMYLPDGGHLSHGWNYKVKEDQAEVSNSNDVLQKNPLTHVGNKKVTAVSKIYNVVQYKTSPETHLFDYDEIEKIAIDFNPKLIITGGTAYPQNIDYSRMAEIAKKIGAYYLADIAHEAGLVAAGVNPSPFPFADFVTFTTHKTFRGPKGAVAMCKKEFSKDLDRSVMPGLLGGPFNHSIAGILQAAYEIDTDDFKNYAEQVIKNAKLFAKILIEKGYDVVSGGTEKHLILVRMSNKNISGKYFSKALAIAGIIANMNTVPYETGSPLNPSGIRFGTPLVTTRGMKESEIIEIVDLIDGIYEVVKDYANLDFESFVDAVSSDLMIAKIGEKVKELCNKFPLKN